MKISQNIIELVYSKKSRLALTTAFIRLRHLLQAFQTVSLFKLINAAVILAFISCFVLHKGFVGLSLSRASRIIGGQILEVMWSHKFSHSLISCLSGIAQTPVARRRFFQLPFSRSRTALTSSRHWMQAFVLSLRSYG